MLQKYKWTIIHWQELLTAVDCVVSHVDFSLRTNTEPTLIFPLTDCAGSSYPHDITLSVSLVLGLQTHAISSLALLHRFWGIEIIYPGMECRILTPEASTYLHYGPFDIKLCFQTFGLQKATSEGHSIAKIKPPESETQDSLGYTFVLSN